MNLERREISTASLAGTRARLRFMSARVIGVTCFTAARLWLKRVAVHSHPAKLAAQNP